MTSHSYVIGGEGGGFKQAKSSSEPKDTKSLPFDDDLWDLTDIERGTTFAEWFEDGVKVVIKRGGASFCVYLGVPLGHPLAGFDYDSLPMDCHGGLTFASEGTGDYLPKGFYFYGWNFKAVFKLVGVVGNVATLITPKTRRITHAPISKLFYTKYSKRKLSQQLSEARASKEVRKNAKEGL